MSVRKTNSPQWKKFQPPAQDPAIMSFHQGPTIVSTSYNNTSGNNGVRETGIIDKLQHSYGFIKCCDREARLFFHFSEYSGDVDTMKIGDAVEFQMSYDRRTGKPIAVTVVKIDDNMVTTEILSEERFVGSIVQVAKAMHGKNGTVPNTQDGLGRVTYEHNGECFFLPYGQEDVSDPGAKLKAGDQVTFFMSTDKRNGNIRARQIETLQPPSQQKFQGVVCSMKETFGFIERSDLVREIFFHYSEFKGNINELILGDDVEFSVQNRNGKEVAVDIIRLPEGTVIFEDISIDKIKGKILKTLRNINNRRQSDPLGGRIIYETPKGTVDIPFGDKDQRGEYTLQQGDVVEFSIATDRRDKLQRATSIQLLDDTFDTVGEVRETGVVVSLKEGYGFIQCADREARMFFHFSELLDPTIMLKVQDELEFTVTQDPSASNRQIAVRIKLLPRGSVSFLTIHSEKYIGTVDREPATHKTQAKNKEQEGGNIIFDYAGLMHPFMKLSDPLRHLRALVSLLLTDYKSSMVSWWIQELQERVPRYRVYYTSLAKNKEQEGGNIIFDYEGSIQSITYHTKDLVELKAAPRYGDKVEFSIGESKSNTKRQGVNVRVVLRNITGRCQGFIATLKDNYGFIENAEHDKEVFFHYSSFDKDADELELGDEVEYILARKSSKLSAENIRKLPKGTVAPEEIVRDMGVQQGKIIRPMRIVNPDQDEYSGMVQVGDDNDPNMVSYPYGITSLADKRDFLQKSDIVKFNLATVKSTGIIRAINIAALRKYLRARVDSVKGQFGFIQYEVEDGKKLFFHMTEVHDGAEIQPGDEVEFVVVQNQRNGKYSACSLRKITDRQRPERLISRLKSLTEDTSRPKLTVVRQPRGPDNTKGFTQPRQLWTPTVA